MSASDERGPTDRWLYVMVVGSLALYLVIGVIAWTWMILSGVTAPEGFTTVLSTIAGGLIGIVAPQGMSRTERGPSDDDRTR